MGQIVMFGLSGGLIPCSAAIAVLVLCLQVNQLWLGIALVACFSIGLALTLMAAGVVGAIGTTPSLAPLAGFRRVRAARALPLQHSDDRPRALSRLAGLDGRFRRPVAKSSRD